MENKFPDLLTPPEEVIASLVQELVNHVQIHTKSVNLWSTDTKTFIQRAVSYKLPLEPTHVRVRAGKWQGPAPVTFTK